MLITRIFQSHKPSIIPIIPNTKSHLHISASWHKDPPPYTGRYKLLSSGSESVASGARTPCPDSMSHPVVSSVVRIRQYSFTGPDKRSPTLEFRNSTRSWRRAHIREQSYWRSTMRPNPPPLATPGIGIDKIHSGLCGPGHQMENKRSRVSVY